MDIVLTLSLYSLSQSKNATILLAHVYHFLTDVVYTSRGVSNSFQFWESFLKLRRSLKILEIVRKFNTSYVFVSSFSLSLARLRTWRRSPLLFFLAQDSSFSFRLIPFFQKLTVYIFPFVPFARTLIVNENELPKFNFRTVWNFVGMLIAYQPTNVFETYFSFQFDFGCEQERYEETVWQPTIPNCWWLNNFLFCNLNLILLKLCNKNLEFCNEKKSWSCRSLLPQIWCIRLRF